MILISIYSIYNSIPPSLQLELANYPERTLTL